MPAKKRTDQTKRTPSTSPSTSTPHAQADHHSRLRHTGPSISTRSDVSTAGSKLPVSTAHPESTPHNPQGQEDYREKQPIAEASRGTRKPFTKFLYVLLLFVLLLFAWYIYGMVTLVEKLKEEVGWWSIIVGNSGGMTRWGTSSCEECGYGADRSSGREDRQAEGGEGGGLEGSLNALADALGISPMEVAAVVKPLIPRASLTSIALNPEQTSSPRRSEFCLRTVR
ncbi:hypothetical protein V8E55_012195 [Tylopilus felleus]